MYRLDENPPSRFPERTIAESEGRWWVVKTKPRQEKALAFEFLHREIEYYLPMYLKVTRRKDNNKPRKSVCCLFPGYVAFCAPAGEERFAYATNRIVNLVEVQHQKLFIRQLDQIYHTIDLGIPLEPWEEPPDFKPGSPVQVEAGPLKGITGTIVRSRSGGDRLVISVDVLGFASVSVDARFVKELA